MEHHQQHLQQNRIAENLPLHNNNNSSVMGPTSAGIGTDTGNVQLNNEQEQQQLLSEEMAQRELAIHLHRAATAAVEFRARGDERPFHCTFEGCAKAFREKKILRKHLLTHQPRRFHCEVPGCGKSFYERAKLKRHNLVHTGEKNFVCTFDGCGKRFALKANLLTHFRVHTGNRPYVCWEPGCGKRFTQTSGRNSHYKTHEKKRKRKLEHASSPDTLLAPPVVASRTQHPTFSDQQVRQGQGQAQQHNRLSAFGLKNQEHLQYQHQDMGPMPDRTRTTPVAARTAMGSSAAKSGNERRSAAPGNRNFMATGFRGLIPPPSVDTRPHKFSRRMPSPAERIAMLSPLSQLYPEDQPHKQHRPKPMPRSLHIETPPGAHQHQHQQSHGGQGSPLSRVFPVQSPLGISASTAAAMAAVMAFTPSGSDAANRGGFSSAAALGSPLASFEHVGSPGKSTSVSNSNNFLHASLHMQQQQQQQQQQQHLWSDVPGSVTPAQQPLGSLGVSPRIIPLQPSDESPTSRGFSSPLGGSFSPLGSHLVGRDMSGELSNDLCATGAVPAKSPRGLAQTPQNRFFGAQARSGSGCSPTSNALLLALLQTDSASANAAATNTLNMTNPPPSKGWNSLPGMEPDAAPSHLSIGHGP